MIRAGYRGHKHSNASNPLYHVLRARSVLEPAARVSRKPWIVAVFLAAAVLVPACGEATMRTAPFRIRPDAADAGTLKGPFTGRVIDSTTHAPIAGALV